MNNEDRLKWIIKALSSKTYPLKEFIRISKELNNELKILAILKQFIGDLPLSSFKELTDMLVDENLFKDGDDILKWSEKE